MKKYAYNWEFMEQWLREHPGMKGKAAAAMGTYAASLDRWVKGRKNPIKLECILSFCNTFDVELASFFLENDSPVELDIEEVEIDNKEVYENDKHNLDLREYEDKLRKMEMECQRDISDLKIAHQNELMKEMRENRNREDVIRRELGDKIKDLEAEIRRIQSEQPYPAHKGY